MCQAAAGPSTMGPTASSETSVTHYQHTLFNIPEQRRYSCFSHTHAPGQRYEQSGETKGTTAVFMGPGRVVGTATRLLAKRPEF